MKWPGSPQRQQAGPGFSATLVAGSGTRNWRGDPGGTGMSAELGLADPASLAWALTAADSGAGPPLHRGWARGTTPARDLGRKIGGDTKGEERERERRMVGFQRRSGFLPRVSATSVTKFVGRKEADRVGS